MNMLGSKPFTLFDAVTGTSTSGVVDYDHNNLTWEYRNPVMICEIRFAGSQGIAAGSPLTTGYNLQVDLRLGDYAITNGLLPISMLGASIQGIVEEFSDNATGVAVRHDRYRWVLPRPMILPPGRPVLAKVKNFYQSRISIAGYALPGHYEMPQEIDVPWATGFIPTSTNSPLASDSTHLVNPFQKDMWVQKMIGRWFSSSTAEDLTHDDSSPSIQMLDSDKNELLTRQTNFSDVFDINRRQWVLGVTLPAKKFYTVKFPSGYTGLPCVTMIGTRKEVC